MVSGGTALQTLWPERSADTVATNMSDDDMEPSESGFVIVDAPLMPSLDSICMCMVHAASTCVMRCSGGGWQEA
jgi:hypothetical protein